MTAYVLVQSIPSLILAMLYVRCALYGLHEYHTVSRNAKTSPWGGIGCNLMSIRHWEHQILPATIYSGRRPNFQVGNPSRGNKAIIYTSAVFRSKHGQGFLSLTKLE